MQLKTSWSDTQYALPPSSRLLRLSPGPRLCTSRKLTKAARSSNQLDNSMTLLLHQRTPTSILKPRPVFQAGHTTVNTATSQHRQLLDLPNEILLRIFDILGEPNQVPSQTFLALTCKRIADLAIKVPTRHQTLSLKPSAPLPKNGSTSSEHTHICPRLVVCWAHGSQPT